MKKSIITVALAFLLLGCKKSDAELQMEHYELQKIKLEYLQALMRTKEDLSYKEQSRVIDSLINVEKSVNKVKSYDINHH